MNAATKRKPVDALSILIVEDEALIAEEIRDRMGRLGYRVAGVVDTGANAILAAEQSRPDLVLMDIRLKGAMDGIETANRIRERLRVPVVFLTAHSDSATIERAKETGPFGFVIKPFQERDLQVAIEMAINRFGLEQRLKESEQKYAATLASISDGVVATDGEGRITYINTVAEALTGWPLADAQGIAFDRVFHLVQESSRTRIESPAVRALHARGVVQPTEPALLISRANDPIPIEVCAAPIKSERGTVIGAVVAFRDIRERRLGEEALRNAEEQLHQEQKLAAVGRLAGGVAHDFNNMLTIINGYCDLLLSTDGLSDASTSQVEQILIAGERAASLTRQLVAFGREQMLRPEVLDLNAVIVTLERLLDSLMGKGINLISALSSDLFQVLADPIQMKEAITNLAINARDAMPEGGQITIETSNVDFPEGAGKASSKIKAGRYVMLAVTDTGCGFDETVKASLFEPFFTTKDFGKGPGLGLATVYGIVKQSDGFIDVCSEPGQGATFTIYLPAVLEKENTPESAMAATDSIPVSTKRSFA